MRNLICLVFGHDWDKGFTETRCRRCSKLKIDRLYQMGHGEGPPDEPSPYTDQEEFEVLCLLAAYNYACGGDEMIRRFAEQGITEPVEPHSQNATLTVLGRERLAELALSTAPQAEAA